MERVTQMSSEKETLERKFKKRKLYLCFVDHQQAFDRVKHDKMVEVMEKAGMRYEGLVDYYGMEGLKKYVAARQWWRPPLAS